MIEFILKSWNSQAETKILAGQWWFRDQRHRASMSTELFNWNKKTERNEQKPKQILFYGISYFILFYLQSLRDFEHVKEETSFVHENLFN